MFFAFHQNNSFGKLTVDDNLAAYVIIEADTQGAAVSKAYQIGIYFDGVHRDMDCPCCGDRWNLPEPPTETPLLYGEKPNGHTIVHYKNGIKERM